MGSSTLRAFLDELEKIADHLGERIKERGGTLTSKLEEERKDMEHGLVKMHKKQAPAIASLPEGATYHMYLSGGNKVIAQKIKGAIRLKTMLSPGMRSNSKGHLGKALRKQEKA